MALQMLTRSAQIAGPSSMNVSRSRAGVLAPAVARLANGSKQNVLLVRRAQLAHRSARSSVVVTRAGDMKYEIAPESSREYAPVLGIIGLVAYVYGRASLNAPLLLKTVAIYQILVASIALVFHRIELDNLASVVTPAILAVYCLNFNQITYMDAAVGLFGYYVAERLEGPFWLWMATLAGAIYAGYPSHWYVAAFALMAGTKLVRGGQKNVIPVLSVPTIAAAGYALWKDISPQFTIALMIGQIVASALAYAESVSDS